MDLTQFGWRDGVIIIAVGVGVYVAVLLLRLLQLGKRKGHLFDSGAVSRPPATESFTPPTVPAADDPPAVEYELPFNFPPPNAAPERLPAHAAADSPEPSFAETLGASRLEQEVRQLRAEVTALREELLGLQAAHRAAPQYADAMALARRGFDARGIADHCGIALGEAELVMALARGADDQQAENSYVELEPGNGRTARR